MTCQTSNNIVKLISEDMNGIIATLPGIEVYYCRLTARAITSIRHSYLLIPLYNLFGHNLLSIPRNAIVVCTLSALRFDPNSIRGPSCFAIRNFPASLSIVTFFCFR